MTVKGLIKFVPNVSKFPALTEKKSKPSFFTNVSRVHLA